MTLAVVFVATFIFLVVQLLQVEPGETPDFSNVKQIKCGRLFTEGLDDSTSPRIIGGKTLLRLDHPFLVRLTMKSNTNDSLVTECGGTIISQRYVLTAAHCMLDEGLSVKLENIRIWAGVHDQTDTSEGEYYWVEQYSIHYGYDDDLVDNDIAVLKTLRPIQYSDEVRSACLPLNIDHANFTHGIVMGWGETSVDEREESAVAKRTRVALLSDDQCTNYKYQVPLTLNVTTSFCAWKNVSSPYHSDSGGPLLVKDREYKLYILGIISFTSPVTSLPLDPVIYTRVKAFLPWIMDHVCPDWYLKHNCTII